MKNIRHDTDARKDPRMQQVIAIHGAQSYGLWWLLLEEVYAEGSSGTLKSDELLIETFVSVGLIDKQLWVDGYIRPNPTNSIAFSKPKQDRLSKEWGQI